MAEFVQQSIEEMLPELEQMERLNLFDKAENRQILKKRQSYEYKLRRRTKCREDFLQYIQYEVNVLKLVEKRRESIGCTYKRLEIDVAIVQRIHKLFRLVCLRFQDDVKLWLSHIEFCKSRNERSYVSRLFVRMLQIHNKKPDLWVMAAKWEFESNINPENARSLLQRGLRFNEKSKDLWLEYYRLELLYAEKMRKRRELLDECIDDAGEALLTGAVANIVYNKAVENFPGDANLVLAFINVCQKFSFMQTHLDSMFNDLQDRYPNHAVTWDALARRQLHGHLNKAVGEDRCFDVYQDAVKKLNTKEMWRFYLKACLDVLHTDDVQDGQDEDHSVEQNKRAQRALKAFSRAAEQHMVEEALYPQWIEVLLTSTDTSQVVDVVTKATDKFPASVHLWSIRLQLMIDRQEKRKVIIKTFRDACDAVRDKTSWPLWKTVLHYLMDTEATDKLHKLLEEAVLSCRQVSQPVKELYLEWTFLANGIGETRNLYHRLEQMKPVSLDFFRKYINMENSQPNPKIKHLRRGYEDAVREFGAIKPDLWIDYIRLEMQHCKGSPNNTSSLHDRAMKALSGTLNQDFVTKHILLQTGRL